MSDLAGMTDWDELAGTAGAAVHARPGFTLVATAIVLVFIGQHLAAGAGENPNRVRGQNRQPDR